MYARPMPFTWGSFLFIQPSAHACHSLSRHIGVPSASTRHIQPLVPSRSCFILLSAVISMIVAFLEIDGGAALIARAIFAASGLVPPFVIVSCPDFALDSSGFAFSWAATVRVAMMIIRPVAVPSAFRMVPSLKGGLIRPENRRKEGRGQVSWCTLVPR